MDNSRDEIQIDFNPELNVLELGQKIRKLAGYIGRADLRLAKRQKQLNKIIRISDQEATLIEIGVRLLDPEKSRGEDA